MFGFQVEFQAGANKDVSDSNDGEALRSTITEVFNMRFVVYEQVCPSEDLTLPQKEMLLFVMKMATFVVLLLLVVFNKFVRRILCCRKKFTPVPVAADLKEGFSSYF